MLNFFWYHRMGSWFRIGSSICLPFFSTGEKMRERGREKINVIISQNDYVDGDGYYHDGKR